MLSRLWSLRRERPLFVWSSIALLALLLVYPLVDWYLRSTGIAPGFGFWDFGVYDNAVERWRAGEPLYVPNESGGYHGSYLYPPAFLLLIWPFALLSFQNGAVAWELFSVLLLWAGLQRIISGLGGDLSRWERGLLLWALLGFQPLLLSVKLGQVAAFFTAMLCFALVAIVGHASEHRVSGAFTGFVGVLKLPYAPSGAYLLRDRRRLAGAAGLTVALGLLSVLYFGLDTHLGYIEVLQWGIGGSGGSRSPRLWLPPYYRPLYAVEYLAGATASLTVRLGIVAWIVLVTLLAVDEPVDRETFALGVAAVPLLSPRTYTYYLVALLPAIVVLLAVELERCRGRDLEGSRGGLPTVPIVATALLQVHAYGLKFLVDHLPAWLPARSALIALAPVLQPGLWGNLLLVGLAATRVAHAASLPRVIRLRLGE